MASSRSSKSDPYSGQTLGGRYVVKRLLAEGGMARVYVARDKQQGRQVAVKVLGAIRTHTDKHNLLDRFRREADALMRLDHPNIVKFLDHGDVEDGGYFIAMELIDGPDLGQWIRKNSIDASQAIGLLLQICSGLRHAHRKGIVHRDLKAANLLVAKDEGEREHIEIIDFGLVQLEDEESIPGEEALFGSVHSIAPEQVKGEETDPRTDIYSLGVIAYRLLVGRYPFHSKLSAEILAQHVQAEVPPFSKYRDDLDLPEGLEDIVIKCMAKKPEDRFESVELLMDELADCLDVPTAMFTLPVQTEDPAVVPKPPEPPPVKAPPMALGVAAVIIVLLVVALAWALVT